MDLLDYDTDSSEEPPTQQSEVSVAVPTFVTYLENYSMKQKNLATAFPFLLCEVSQQARAQLRARLASAIKTVKVSMPAVPSLYDLDNIIDQLSFSGGVLGANNSTIGKKLHITLFPTAVGRKHEISQFSQNMARCIRQRPVPDMLVASNLSVLDDLLGNGGRGRTIRLPLEPKLGILTLRNRNVLFINSRVKRTPQSEEFLKGLSAILGEQADSLNLSYDWWKHVGVSGLDDCLYHVSFLAYTLKRPGTAIKFSQLKQLEKALAGEVEPIEDLSVDIDSLVIMNTPTKFKKISLV